MTRESEIKLRNPNKYFHIIIIMSALFGKITPMNSHRQKGLTKNVEIEIQTWRLISSNGLPLKTTRKVFCSFDKIA
jgi:hypothetical protein